MKTFFKAFGIASMTAFGIVLGFSLSGTDTSQAQTQEVVITLPEAKNCANGTCNEKTCQNKKSCATLGCNSGCGCTGKR